MIESVGYLEESMAFQRWNVKLKMTNSTVPTNYTVRYIYGGDLQPRLGPSSPSDCACTSYHFLTADS